MNGMVEEYNEVNKKKSTIEGTELLQMG